MKIEISAPGKTVLHGEHAVVYGKAAVAVSLSLRTYLILDSHDEDKVLLTLKNLNVQKEWNLNDLNNFSHFNAGGDIMQADEESIKHITDAFELNSSTTGSESEKLAVITFLFLCIHISKCYNAGSFAPCVVHIDSELTVGSGMGSSASFSVCLATALLISCGRITPRLLPEDKELINKWAFQAEKIFHGKPSGIDNSICTYGGALLFENGLVADVLPELQNINVLLVNTRVPRNTKALVADVRQKKEAFPSIIDPVFESIDAISKQCWNLLKNTISAVSEEEMAVLEDMINMNHHLLNSLGVGHPKLNQIHDIAESYHCASKLTGAGGGGSAIILLPIKNTEEKSSIIDSLKKELQNCDFDIWDIFAGTSGVQVKFQ